MTGPDGSPIVPVTGAAGNLGRSVAAALAAGYRILGLDRQARASGDKAGPDGRCPVLTVNLGSDQSVASALKAFRSAHGARAERRARRRADRKALVRP